MDLKLAKLRELRINMESNADLHIDLNTTPDLELGRFSFAGSDEGEDFTEFLKERVGNYDYLDIDEEDLKTIPSPDVDASADPVAEEVFLGDYQKHARGDGAGNRISMEHHEHLRETREAAGPDVDELVNYARKAMMAGVRGDDLLRHLADRYDKTHLMAAASELKASTVDQHLLGNVILEPELFASCGEMERFLKENKVAGTAKFAKTCSDCRGCSYRAKSRCQRFATTLVREMPDSPKVFAHYATQLMEAKRLPTKVAKACAQKARDNREATAAIFAWVEMSPKKRREVQSHVPSVGVPERRSVAQNPREAQIQQVTQLINTGAPLSRIKAATFEYLGRTPFERVAREAIQRRGSMPWTSFAKCDHPLLMDKTADFTLDAGEDCTDCVHNYGDHCHMNQKAFTEPFLASEEVEINFIPEEESFFAGSTPTIDASPSLPNTPALEPYDVEGLDEGFEV